MRLWSDSILFLVNDEEVISLSYAKVHVFSDSVLCLGKMKQNQKNQILFGNDSWNGSKIHYNTEHWTQSTENQWNLRGIFSQDFSTLKLVREVQKFIGNVGEPEQFQGRIIFMSMFEAECMANSTFVSLVTKRFAAGRWPFFGLGVAELMKIRFRESGHPVLRATSPLSRGTLKSKGCNRW